MSILDQLAELDAEELMREQAKVWRDLQRLHALRDFIQLAIYHKQHAPSPHKEPVSSDAS